MLHLTNLMGSIPAGFTLAGIASGILSLFWHLYNSYFKLPTIQILIFRPAGQYEPIYGNGLKIEIINSTTTPIDVDCKKANDWLAE